MEIFKSRDGYSPLMVNLEGHWETPLSHLPRKLKLQVSEACFPLQWDSLSSDQRRNMAAQHDYQNDPAHEPVLYFELECYRRELQEGVEKAEKVSRDTEALVLRKVIDRVEAILETDRSRYRSITEEKAVTPTLKKETTYLNIIGGLLDLMLGETPAGKKQSVFKDNTAIIDALVIHHGDKHGISKRTLEGKFAAAKRSLSSDL